MSYSCTHLIQPIVSHHFILSLFFSQGFPDEPSHESPRSQDAGDTRPGGRSVRHGVGEERDAALAPAAHAARPVGPALGRSRGLHEAASATALRGHASAHESLAVRDSINRFRLLDEIF